MSDSRTRSRTGTPVLNRRIRSCAVSAAAVTLVAAPLLLPASAQADELRFTDRTQDVVKVDLADESLETRPDPTTSNGDIKSVFIHYRKGHLVLRANFVDLVPARNTLVELAGEIRTNEKRHYEYDVVTSPGHYAGHDTLTTRSGRRACQIGHRLDYRENFARVSIALSCLSNPPWVRVLMGAATIPFAREALGLGPLDRGEPALHMDAALRDTADSTGWTPGVPGGCRCGCRYGPTAAVPPPNV